MWSHRSNNLSLKLSHSVIEELAAQRTKESSVEIRNEISEINSKMNLILNELKNIKISNDNNNFSDQNLEIKKNIDDYTPLPFIPSVDLNNKKINDCTKVEVRKRVVDLDSTLTQLEAVTNENN